MSVPWRHAIVLAIVLAGGLGTSLALERAVRRWERDRLQTVLTNRAAERAQLLQTKMLCSMESLHSIASMINTCGEVDRKTFRLFVQDALDRQPDLQALGWTPRIPREKRALYEAAVQADGWPNFEFTQKDANGTTVRVPDQQEYYPVDYIEPLGTNYAAVGFNLFSDESRRTAMERARDTGLAIATPAIHLVQESDNQLGLVVYLPIYRNAAPHTVTERRQSLMGFASAVFRIQNLVRPMMEELSAEGLDVHVRDESDGGRQVFHLSAPTVLVGSMGTAELPIAGRNWIITLRPSPAFAAALGDGQSTTLFWTGLLITLLLAAYIYAGLRRTAEIERRVGERTMQLSAEVAERKRAEVSARHAESRYRSIFENSIEGIFQTSPDGRYISANKSLARIYGHDTIEQLISDLTNIAGQLYVEPGRRAEFIQLVQRDGEVSEFESQVYRKDGRIIWISENARAARDDQGRVLYYEGTVVDITERKLAESLLRRNRDELESRVTERTLELARINQTLEEEIAVRKRAEEAAAAANRAKSAFLASMSHEIRTPMNAILGYAQVLERDPTLRASHREAMQTVISSGNHLLELIDDVLEISKIEAGRIEMRPSEFELDALMRDVAGMFRQRCRQKGISLRVEDLSDDGRRVIGDERKLRQVLINLMGNAVKFTDHGSVILRVGSQDDNYYKFEVIDTGIGIAIEARCEIFEAFNQGPTDHRRGGSGLGLAIARQHIELMGGHLTVSSSTGVPDSGSTFSFVIRLPAARRSGPVAKSSQLALSLAAGRPIRALVVDDVPENRDVLARMLGMFGCEVALAESGGDAIARMEKSHPDIVFVDILMPDMGGVETARRIRKSCGARDVKLVAASASALAHEQREYLEAGFDAFLAKPVKCERIHQMLAALFELTAEMEAPDSAADFIPMMGLPRTLRERLLGAAAQYRITELKQCIDEIEKLHPQSPGMPEFLRGCLRRYDMEAIVDAVTGASPLAADVQASHGGVS